MNIFILTLIFLITFIPNASAYVGPGLGLGAIGAFFGAILAVLLAIIGIIWYPFKRLIKKIKGNKEVKQETKQEPSQE